MARIFVLENKKADSDEMLSAEALNAQLNF